MQSYYNMKLSVASDGHEGRVRKWNTSSEEFRGVGFVGWQVSSDKEGPRLPTNPHSRGHVLISLLYK